MGLHLTPRLLSAAQQVPHGAKLADIGTDHAYLPVWLLLKGVIDGAIAADLREGPLRRAQETARQYGVWQQISFRLCDGLSAICPEEADTIVIAGMGGDTIASILHGAPWTGQKGKQLLLQPMTAQMHLRKWLWEHGCRIDRECISQEGKRLYTVLCVTAGTTPVPSPGVLWAGQQSGDPLRGAYLDLMMEKARHILDGQHSARKKDGGLVEELEQIVYELEQMRKEL